MSVGTELGRVELFFAMARSSVARLASIVFVLGCLAYFFTNLKPGSPPQLSLRHPSSRRDCTADDACRPLEARPSPRFPSELPSSHSIRNRPVTRMPSLETCTRPTPSTTHVTLFTTTLLTTHLGAPKASLKEIGSFLLSLPRSIKINSQDYNG